VTKGEATADNPKRGAAQGESIAGVFANVATTREMEWKEVPHKGQNDGSQLTSNGLQETIEHKDNPLHGNPSEANSRPDDQSNSAVDRPFFFAGTPEASFNFSIFIEQFLLHVFGILYFPVFQSKRGPQALNNNGMWPPSGLNVFANLLPAIAWPVVIALFFAYRPEFEARGIAITDVFLALVPMFAHRLMVGLKYAVCTEEEYIRYLSTTDPVKHAKNAKQLQIVYSLTEDASDTKVIMSEICLAAARTLVPVEDSYCEVVSRKEDWKRLLKNTGPRVGLGGAPMQTEGFARGEVMRHKVSGLQVQPVYKVF
jgi:hypothetical protein